MKLVKINRKTSNLIKSTNSEFSPREKEAFPNMDSEFSEDEDIEEAKLRNLRLKRLGSFKAPNRNSLSRVKRLSQSNYELNAITPFKSKFTLF